MTQLDESPSAKPMTECGHRVTPSEVHLALTEERERRRIARGLHDDVGQILVLVHGKLGQLAASEVSPARARELEDLRDLVMPAIDATRTLTFDLASPALYEFGLESALRGLGERLQARHGVRFHFEAATDPQCAPAEEVLVIFHRCVRELLRNVADHAQASQVRMRLAMRRHRIEISVEDNGKGFDPAGSKVAFTPSGKYGLHSIRQQVECLGGRFEITASPGNGTRIVIAVPLQPAGETPRSERPGNGKLGVNARDQP